MKKILAFTILAAATACSASQKSGSGADKPGTTPPPATAGSYDLVTAVQGQPADGKPVTTQSTQLQFGLSGHDKDSSNLKLQGFECRTSKAGEWKACVTPFALNELRSGESLDISVRAVVIDVTTNQPISVKETELSLKIDLGDSVPAPGRQTLPPEVNGVRALSDKLEIGNAYEVDVPVGMHVTEYATSKTTGVLSFFRITPESDPYYLFNYSCVKDWDRVVADVSPSGEPLTYCHSTPTQAAYKAENEARLANNHVEIATDTKLVTKNGQERLTVSIFDEDYELTADHTRFGSSCQNSEKRYITVPMIPNFFLGKNPEQVDFWICDVYMPDMNGEAVQWRVGAFYDVDHMDWHCPSCAYPRAVEMTYMARVSVDNHLDANFAKIAQKRLLDVMTKLTP